MLNLQTEVSSEIIEDAVENIFESSVFRSSKQSQLLLRYIVDNSLSQRDELLRERVIGAEVFGRPPDYDTGNDPIVRSRVADVRKRLAQYYLERRDDVTVHISIPSGAYRATFSSGTHISIPKESPSLTQKDQSPDEVGSDSGPSQERSLVAPAGYKAAIGGSRPKVTFIIMLLAAVCAIIVMGLC
jgi:hypothetical protein